MTLKTPHLVEFLTRATITTLVACLVLGVALAQKTAPNHTLDLNSATVAQLRELPGIGPSTVKSIVAFREKSGPFQRVEDLPAIHGISSARLEKLRPYVTVGTASGAETSGAKPSAGHSGYHHLKEILLGGDGGWDILSFDSPTRRLFISRQSKVIVVNVDTEKVVGEIPNTDGVHAAILVPEFNKGFTTNGRAGTLTVFNLKTLAVTGSVQAGSNPDAGVYDPASKRVFVVNGRSSNATVIDAATNTVVGTVDLAGKPEFPVADGAGHVYINIEDKSEIVQLDSQAMKITARWPLAPCQEPSGLAIDTANRRLFAGCDNKMMAVVDADSGKVIATPPIGEGVDGCEFDPGTGFAFSSNGQSATLTVVREESPAKFSVVEDVATQRGARTMTIDPRTHEVYLVTADFGPRPAPTQDNPHPRPPILPNSFVVLVYGR